jgi:uncharacterized protein (UPF0335 family)
MHLRKQVLDHQPVRSQVQRFEHIEIPCYIDSMRKKKNNLNQYNIGLMQPTEINTLRSLVKEFVGRIENIDSEIELLKEDRKSVIEEYSQKLDYKTLQSALRVVKIQSTVEHKDTFDLFMEVLEDPT